MSSTSLPASAARVVEAAARHGLALAVTEFPDGTRTAQDAAAAMGCAVDQIVKSMIFAADDEIVLALTSGAHQVDPQALAALAGAAHCGRADPDRVRTVTGYAIGGVPPFGHHNPVRTWIDPHLLRFDEVWAAAGTPRHVFPIAPGRLVAITAAVAAPFTAHSPQA
ncbi:MAG: YbaK/EbsC family protein [Acidimicrobiia bacterium]|nr:YbaK/EbsC family protein [Acidimicrobiia bacterium]MDH5290656.1 YbaK/EbsC family protein [Acidimicrobiia bacterium]